MDFKKFSKLLFFSTILILFSCEKKQYNYIHYYQKVNEIDSIYRFTNNPIETVKRYKLLFNQYPAKNQSRIREYETYIVLADRHNIDFGGKKSLNKLIYLTAPYSDFGRNTE
ncbi:MAG: hypothetical protein KBS93_05395 [Flavobacteriaceae bacterium]|nr:hypothetical protein [Candidatus Onthonaster equi]